MGVHFWVSRRENIKEVGRKLGVGAGLRAAAAVGVQAKSIAEGQSVIPMSRCGCCLQRDPPSRGWYPWEAVVHVDTAEWPLQAVMLLTDRVTSVPSSSVQSISGKTEFDVLGWLKCT